MRPITLMLVASMAFSMNHAVELFPPLEHPMNGIPDKFTFNPNKPPATSTKPSKALLKTIGTRTIIETEATKPKDPV